MRPPELQAPPQSPAPPRPASPPMPPAAPIPSAQPTPPTLPTPDTAWDSELQIARLEGRVAALEAALERRSDELRLLQRHLCPHDLAQLARLTAGLPPLPRIACEPSFWRETRELTAADVPETLEALWSSLYPAGLAGPPAPPEPASTAEPAAAEPPAGVLGPAGTPPTPRTPR